MNVIVPLSSEAVPPTPFETPVTVRLPWSLSSSVSLSTRVDAVIVTSVSSVPEAPSSTATGSSLTHVMSTVADALSVPPLPSEIA